MRRARWKRKHVRRVGLRLRRPPAAGGGWLALPCRSQGRKRTALGESLGPGRFRDTPASLSAAAHASAENQPARSDAERAKREAGQMRSCTPTTSAPSATGRQLQTCRREKRARRQAKIGACTDTSTSVSAEGHCTGARPSGLFFWTVHGPFSFPQVGKENGGCIPAGQAPCGSRDPRGRRDGGPSHVTPACRFAPPDSRW